MRLADFLKNQGTDKDLSELILFLGKQSLIVKRGFLCTPGKEPECGKTCNVYGEEQMALDKYADGVFIDALRNAKLVRYIATEEQEQIIEIDGAKNDFGIVMDPLDGSSLIDVNLCVGTIIGICPGNVLDKGSRFVAALYILYGPMPAGSSTLKMQVTSSASAAVSLPTSTRSSTKVVSSPTRASRARRRGNSVFSMRRTPWAGSSMKPAGRQATAARISFPSSLNRSARSPRYISAGRPRSD